jgi:hypothetical protein
LGLTLYARHVLGQFDTKYVLPAGSQSGWRTYEDFNFHHVGWDNNVFDSCFMLNQADPLLAKDMDVDSYKGYLWDDGYWDWLSGWRLGDTDPLREYDTEVD